MKRYFCSMIALLTLGLSHPVSASEATSTPAADVTGALDGYAYFEAAGNRSERPACAAYTRWAIDVATPSGQATLAVLISGVATGRKFYVSGQGTCINNSELVWSVRWLE